MNRTLMTLIGLIYNDLFCLEHYNEFGNKRMKSFDGSGLIRSFLNLL
jgi:hypothetical protein